MTVYVDDMAAPFGRMKMCHMIADTEAELHAMADKIGVARKWYQGDHYDIALTKRALAVSFGAKEITLRQCGIMSAQRDRDPNAPLMPPHEAEQWMAARIAARRERAARVAAPHVDGGDDV